MAIENAHLYEEARDRARRLEAVRAITTAILAGTDTGELLGLVVGHARELVGADLATLALPAGTDRLVIEAADGLLAEELQGTDLPGVGVGDRRGAAHRQGGGPGRRLGRRPDGPADRPPPGSGRRCSSPWPCAAAPSAR